MEKYINIGTKSNTLTKLFLLLVVVFAIACKTQKYTENNNTRIVEKDSTTYELIVLEIGFEPWYVLQNQPSGYRNIEYYRYWNTRYVSEWNYRVTLPSEPYIFNDLINYEVSEKYPFEIEHKLFHYFLFVENKLKVPIITGGPRPN